jgi:acyl-CoA dehydrogenase
MIQDLARQFAKEEIAPVAAEYDKTMDFPDDIFKQAWELGLVNTKVPVEYDGPGLGAIEGVVIAEELAWGCTGIMTAIEANGLGQAPVIFAGTDAQKKEYLGRLTAERTYACLCVCVYVCVLTLIIYLCSVEVCVRRHRAERWQ